MEANSAVNYEVSHQIYGEQVKQLLSVEHLGFIATLINSSILVLMQWTVTSQKLLVSWFCVLMLITVVRYLLLRTCRASAMLPEQAARWAWFFTVGAAISGVTWGSAGTFMIPAAPGLHQIFVPFILGGMVAGAAVVYSAIRRGFFAFAIPALLPSVVHFYLIGDNIHFAMAAMLLLFLAIMIVSVLRLNEVVNNSIALQFENKDLVADLVKGKELAEGLNKRLKLEIAERKSVDEKLQEHRQKLERAVREKTAQLVRSNEQLLQEISPR